MTAFPEAHDIAPKLGDPNAVAELAKLNRASRYDESRDPTNTFDRAAELDWISNIALRQMDRLGEKSDPNFVLTADKIKEYNKDLPPEWADEFSGVSSDAEAKTLRQQLLQRQRITGQLQEAGWVGSAARFGANIVDPAALAFGLASGGAGWISKGGRITRMAKAGLVAAAGAVPIAAYQTSQDPDGEVADVLYNSAFAFALGSGGHALGEAISGRWAQKTLRELEARDLKALPPGEITEKAKIRYADELNADPLRDAIDAEAKIAVSESDTHADDFTGLDEAANSKQIEIVDAEATNTPRTSDVEVDVPGTANSNVGGSATDTTAAAPETTTSQGRRDFGDVLGHNEPIFESLKTGEPFSATLYRTATAGRQDYARGSFYGSKKFVEMLNPILEGDIGKHKLSFDNPLVFWSKRSFLDKLAESGDARAATLSKTLDITNKANDKITNAHAERYITKKAKEMGHDAWVSQFEMEVVDTGSKARTPGKGEASFIVSTNKNVPGTAKVSETDTSANVVVPEPQLLQVETLAGKKPAWSMTRDEFASSFPLPDKKEKITVQSLSKSLESSTGDPGYTIENGIVSGMLTDRVKNVVYRGRSGKPIGILRVVYGEDGKTIDSMRVAVNPQSRRRGFATKLFEAADRNGIDVSSGLGSGPMTKEGAAFVHRREVAKAIRARINVPQNIRDEYPGVGVNYTVSQYGKEVGPFTGKKDEGPNFVIRRDIVHKPQGVNIPPGPAGPDRQLPPPGGPLSKLVRTWRDFIANPVDSVAAMTRVRWGIAGRLGASEVPEMRMAASVYVQDSLARKGGAPAPYAGNTWVSREWRSNIAEIERESAQHIQSFLDSQKIPVHQRFAATEALQRAVSWELEGGPVSQVIPEAKAIADIHRRKYAELLEVAKRHGVPGFENVKTNPDYFPHLHNVGAINDAVKQYGLKNIEDLYAKGMIADGWDPVDATKVAPGYVQALLNLGSYSDLDKIRLFAGDAETLKATFKRFNIGLTDADAERIAKYLSPEDAGVNPRARRRVGLNTMVSSDLTDKNGNTTKLFLHQLIENNAQAVMHKYTRQILGAAAEAEILRAMSTSVDPSGATVFKTFDELRNHIERQYQTRGVLTDRGRARADLDRLTAIRKALVGIPLNDQSTFNDIARLIRAYNFIRGSGTFGIAQAVEFGKVVGEYGLEPIAQQWPALGKLFSRAQNGELTNETLREIEALGMGAERITNQVTARFDDQIGIEEFGGKGLETTLRRGEKFAGDVSLMVPVTIAQQRMAGLAAGQTILNLAMSGRPLSARRLADIGLDAPMWQRIIDQVKQHATKDGVRLRAFNFDNWNDTEAAANLASSLDRWSRRAIQDSDMGSMSLWMTKPVGRMVIQFRTFAIQSWEKQTLRTIQVRDARAFIGWALTGVLGSLAYVGQQYAGSLTDKDKRRALKKNLSMKNIAAQGFARSGASSILPSVVDTTSSFFGADPLFQSRYSGLSSRGLMSNPTFDLFDSGNQFARGLGRAMMGGTMTRGEARAGAKLLPFQNVVGIRNALDAMTDGLPRNKE